jgi:predicted DNA-binding protein (UPF0278 family)
LWENTLLKAAKQVYRTSRPGVTKKVKHWWTPEIGNMIKEKKKKWKKYLSVGTLETFEEYRRQRDIAKKAIQEAKKKCGKISGKPRKKTTKKIKSFFTRL